MMDRGTICLIFNITLYFCIATIFCALQHFYLKQYPNSIRELTKYEQSWLDARAKAGPWTLRESIKTHTNGPFTALIIYTVG